jgi:uncharacterized protein (TIGR00297 family)
MLELSASGTAKIERERRLQWQSTGLLTAIFMASSAGLIALVWQSRTLATIEGLAICAVLGVIVWKLRAATPLAAITGFLLTSTMYLATVVQPHGGCFHTALPPGLTLLILAFAATRFRRSHKERSGLAESREGRRASQVAANMGAAAIAALFPMLFPSRWTKEWMILALIAALAEAAADTLSSEIGQALGGQPILITNLKRVPPGTDGAISFTGTVAGFLAAAIVVATAIPTLRLDAQQAAIAWVAAIVGLFTDSFIGATLERGGWLNNDLVNFLSTIAAAFFGVICLSALQR